MYGRGNGGSQQVRFGPPVTPDLIKTLMLVNVGVFILQHLARQGGFPFVQWFAAWPVLFWTEGFVWQPFTYMWMHAEGSLMHIGFNMLALWMFGSPLASAWGPKRFLRFYVICGVGAGLIIMAWPLIPGLLGMGASASFAMPTLGASGAIYGVLLAYSLTWPDRTIMLLFPPIPIKALYFIPFLFGMEFLFGPANVSHAGHLGGVFVGWILFRRWHGESILPSRQKLQMRWRRFRMRRQLHEVRREQERYWQKPPGNDPDDRRMH